MKGMIFTEFLEMVEDQFSLSMVDKIIEAADLPSGGAYTAVGTYDHSEIVQLVVNLSQETAIPVSTLLKLFGERLFQSFSVKYAHFLTRTFSAFAFLERLETYVHAEVRKLYPEAELPHFECIRHSDRQMTMCYHSHRSLGDVAEGLIAGCFAYFGEDILIERQDLSDGRGTHEQFTLTRVIKTTLESPETTKAAQCNPVKTQFQTDPAGSMPVNLEPTNLEPAKVTVTAADIPVVFSPVTHK